MASLNCPHCRHHLLELVHHDNIELDACVHCGGLWFDRNELDKVVRAYDSDYPREGPIVESLGRKLAHTQKRCPRCKIPLLVTYQFEQGSKLQIDACYSCHGVWLENGELDHAKIVYEIPEAVERIQKETTWGHWLFQFFLHLPVEFNIKARKFPLITVILMVLNGLLMLSVMATQNFNLLESWGVIPVDISSFHGFVTLFTHQFLHSGWAHLIGNMYFLYILGDNVEDAMGRIVFPIFYLLCGVVAGLAHVGYELTIGESAYIPLIGASGAISGVMAAYLYIFRQAKLTFMLIVFQYKLSVFWYFGIWIGFNVLLLIMGEPGISWVSHISGFIAGLVFSYFLYERILKANPLICYLNQA